MAEKDIEYYRNLTERAGRDFVNRQPDDPFKTVSLPSEAFKRYKGLNVLASDIYGGKEIDNRYSLTQGFLDRTFRDFKVFGANAASMFATTIISLPDLLFNYDTEKSFIENMGDTPMVKSIFEWRKEIEEGNINFNTAVDDETGTWSTIKNTVLPGWMTGSSKGWGELFRSAGYAVGTMGSMLIPGPGTVLGNVARLTGAARGVGKFASLTNQVVNRLNNPSLLRNSSSLIDDIVNTSKSLNAAANTIDKFNKIKDVAKFMHRGLMGAYGEAAFEGLESEQAVIDDLTKDFIEKNGYSPYGEDLENIKKIAKEARTANFWMNISMLIFSNSYQMGRLFRHIDAQKETVEAIARKGLKFEVVDGKPQVMARTLQSDWFQKGFGKKIEPFARGLKSLGSPRSIFVESLSEGLEEFTQEAFSNAVNNYAKMRYNTNGKKGVLEALSFIGKGIQDSMTDEGLRSFLSGVMVGGGQQLIQSAIALPSQIRNKGKIIDELNITLANYEDFDIKKVGKYMNVDSLRGTIIDKVFDTQAAKNIGDAMDVTTDVKTYKDLEDMNFFNLSKPYLMRGHADILKQQFKYAVENYEGDISEIFNTKSSKQDVIDSFNRKIDDIAQSYNFVSNSFRNPYDPTKSEEEAIKAGMFNNAFIPELAYQHWRLKRLQERKNSLESELGGLYEEFKNTTSEEKIPKLEKQIEKRIKDISEGASTPQTNSAKKYYESSLKHLKEFKELINDEEVDNEQRRKKYNEFMTHYMQAVYSYIGSKPEAFSVDDFQQKVEDLTQILLDLDLVERNVSKYLSGDYFNLVYENYIKATKEFLTQSELERVEKVFGDLENYQNYADENYQKYVETGLIDEDVFGNLLKTANDTEEKLTEQLQELANKEIDRRLEIENFVADWMKKLSHLKSETLSQDILDIITKHASNKKRPELTKEVKEKIEEELKAKLPLKKEEETSSSKGMKTPSDVEVQIAEIERGRKEELGGGIIKGNELQNIIKKALSKLNTKEGITPLWQIIGLINKGGAVYLGVGNFKGAIDYNEVIKEIYNIYPEYEADKIVAQLDKEIENSGRSYDVDKINDKYDAKYVEAVKKGKMTKEQAMQALEEIGRKDSSAYAELTTLESKTTTSSSNTAQTPSDIEAQIADIERRSGESVKDFINRLFENNYLVEVDGKQFFSLTQGRWGVVVNINGVKVPFYQSTSGTDTKIVGQWYPFFGDLGNWLIKGDSNDSNIGYGFKAIQDVQSFLNKNIKERDAIATSGLIPSVVNQNKDDLRKLDEDKIKGNEKISLNREATAKRLSELLGYTVEEGRKTKSDTELFALASKKVFSELAALESKTTTSSGGQVKMISPEEMKKLRDEKRHLESRLEIEELSQKEEESIIKRIDEITAIIVEQSKSYYNKGVNYNGFKSAVNKIKEENSLDEVLNHDNIQLIPKNSISLWEIFNKTEFEKLSDPIKVDLLNAFKEYFTEWTKEADSVLKELKKNEPETLNVLGYQIIKFSDNEYVLKIGDETFKFTHFNDALVKIAKEGISNVEEQISSIENKFENRDWNPIPSEDLTLEEKQREEDERNWMIRTLNDMSLNMTEEDMMSDIAENTTVEVWSFDSTDSKFQLDRAKYKNKKTRLPDEKILGSTISDTIRFRYNKDGVTFSYQSIKHPIDSIRFFDKKHIRNEIQLNVENENLKVALLLLLNNYNIENLTYYQFLLDASVENSDARRLYELFQIAGFLKFKGSIQEQIKSIEEKQKIFDDIKNTRSISNYSLKRVFDGLQTNPKKQRFNVPIQDVEHPFVMKTDNGTTRSDFVFFRFPDDVTSGQKFNIDFIDPKYRANNEHEKELIGISIESQLKKLPKLYSGYYILFTSSTGTPYIIRLSTKPITRERANEILNDDSISKLDKLRAFSIIDSSYLTGSSQSRAMYFNESKGFVYYNVKYFDENGVEFSHSNSVPDSALTDYDSFIDWINDVNKKLYSGKAKWHKKLPDGTWIKENSDGTAILKPVEAKFIPIEGGSARVPQSTNEVLERYNISQIGTRQFNVDKFVITPKGEKGNKVHTNLIPQTPPPSEPPTFSQTPSSFTEIVSLEELSSSEYSELVKSVLDEAKSINSNITFYDEKYIADWLETNFPNEENKNVLTTFVIYGLIGNLDRNSNIPQELNNDIDKAKLVRAANSPAFAIKQNINNAFQLGKIPLELTVPGTHYKSTPPTTSVEIDVTKEVDYLLSKCS